jgi:hypothetical protein
LIIMRGAISVLLGFALGSAIACFSPPTDDVLFACEFEGDDRCPPDYRCEVDNCCHRIGSDVDAELGGCALGGNTGVTSEMGETETGETG